MRILALSLAAVAAATCLSACQTLTPEQRRAADETQCLHYGFRRGTDGFAACLQRIDLYRRAQARYDSDMLMMQMAYDLDQPYYGRRYWRHW
ncbi:hypothetical protein SAMN05216228_100113 [Rhizobium tibeticum]|uniref:Lipoprotein n=1 Tax=Rhizobium tibeticum TaxID=501024 RepID=A0A1H8C5Y5_9HYPH|nr:hypothetical protein [Rhizobium tibeticum]SEH45308.1 hypothetical protein RTCCBAU85039_0461 [Rhizobium tibeticum]SEM90485.1 hypothetical protein SAMN05216228_100113 [Rhizobium tibeticum]